MYTVFFSSIGSAILLGAFGWAMQTGNRLTALETRQTDIITLINAKFDGVNQRLDRIEKAMNGSLHK